MRKQSLRVLVAVIFIFISCNQPGKYPSAFSEGQLPLTIYTIDPGKDTVLRTEHGALISIPAGAMDVSGGTMTAQLEIKEAYTIAEMIRGGLTTTSGGNLLSSGGMISIMAAGGQELHFKKAVTVSIPTDRLQEGMRLYKGKKDQAGKIDWTDPAPLQENPLSKGLDSGKALFTTNCAPCHGIGRSITGPDLAWIPTRRDYAWLLAYIRNNAKSDSNDLYKACLANLFNNTAMPVYPALDNQSIDQVLRYIDNESRLIDSNSVRDYKKIFDSCFYYNRLVDSIQKRRSALIKDNDSRTQQVFRDESGRLETGSHPLYVRAPPVKPMMHPAIYYKFTVESFGWFNVDLLVNDLHGAMESQLSVRIRAEYSQGVNVFLVIPGRKVLCEGGFLKDRTDEFGFLTEDGKIPLPQGEQACVIAMGEYKSRMIFGVQTFVTSRKEALNLELSNTTKEQMNEAIERLSFDRLTITVADSKNAVQIRGTDSALAAIEQFRPKDCDCHCGLPMPVK